MVVTPIIRTAGSLAAAGIIGIGAAACGGSGSTQATDTSTAASSTSAPASSSAAPSSSVAPTATSAAAAPAPTALTSASASASASSQDVSPSQGTGATGQDCTADHLDIAVAVGDSAAGSVHYTVSFTNTGDSACRLAGYPGVSAVGDDGTQIGKSAQRSGEEAAGTTIAPHGRAEATLTAANIDDGGGALGESCKATEASGWRVYAPGSKDSVVVKEDGMIACAGDVDWLTIDSVQAA